MQSLDRPTRQRVAELERAAAAGEDPGADAVAAELTELTASARLVATLER